MKRFIPALMVCGALLSHGCSSYNNQLPQSAVESAHGPTVVVDDANFEQVVLQADKPVLVDFWATWCGPCQVIAPIVNEIAADYEGRAIVAKLDVDQAAALAGRYQVESIPTLIVFRGGEEVSRVVGTTSKEDLTARLEAALR